MDNKPLFHVYLEHRVTGRCTTQLTKKPISFDMADSLVRLYMCSNKHATMKPVVETLHE